VFPVTSLNHADSGGGGNRTRVVLPDKPLKHAEDGYLYFIQAEAGGPIKIGYTGWPEKRLVTLQVAHAEKLVILAKTKTSKENERQIHEHFAGSRIRGEWYEPTPELLANIAEVDSWTAWRRGETGS
jgi:hypothetical protein